MAEKETAPRIRAMKASGKRIVCITAYDALFGRIADEAGVDVVLVGDSLGNTILGYDNTIPVSLEEMVHHTKAVRAGVHRALLVSDLPFGSYQASPEDAVRSAVALAKAGAEAVKLEGDYSEAARAIIRAGIPVMGHVGMTPQSVNRFGGHRVQGKGEGSGAVAETACALDEAGVFATVLELIPSGLAKQLTSKLSNPTIGIGAGADCDGQIQVIFDVLGMSSDVFRHAKAYVDGANALRQGIERYSHEVREGSFPDRSHSF